MNTPFENSFLELTGEEFASASRGERVIAAPHEVNDPAAFMLGGKAYFTLRSVKTGTRFTYRVTEAEPKEGYEKYGKSWFVSLLNGPDNWSNYQYMGQIRQDRRFYITKGSKVGADASSARAFSWVWSRLTAGQDINGVEVWHEGKCGRCGRKLTVPESIETGFGPECASKLQ